MGTCNFHAVNADRTYVLYDYFEEDGERYENEWSFLKEDILFFGLERGWDDSKQRSFRFCRDSDISVISKEFWFEYKTSGLKYKVEAFITMNPGYYEHCNLDYRLVLDYEEGDTPKDELLDRIIEDFTDDIGNCYISYVTGGLVSKVWNRGLRNAHKNNFEKEASKFIDNIIEECEQMCKDMSHDTYKRVGVFSNGEGIYEKLQSSMDKIYEWCPYCCDEVELDNKFESQICPSCGKPILPCSLCYTCLGWNDRCPLRDKEKKLNAMFGFND